MRVVLYGVGSGCDRVLMELKEDIEVTAFVDTMKAGLNYKGQVVRDPRELLELQFDYVLVCSQFFAEIYDNLVEIGIGKWKILNAINFIMQHPDQIRLSAAEEVIVTGMSYAWGIKDTLIGATSLAAPSQDLLCDYCFMEDYLEDHSPRIALIGITYFSFSYSLLRTISSKASKTNVGTINRLAYIKNRIEISDVGQIFNINEMNSAIVNDVRALNILIAIKSGKQTFAANGAAPSLPGPRRSLAERHGRIFPETEHKNIEIMHKILQLLGQRGISPVLFIAPQHEEYRRYYPIESKDRFYEIMSQFRGKYSFQLFDFFDDDRFNENDFIDADHLNEEGNLKLTQILHEEINRK